MVFYAPARSQAIANKSIFMDLRTGLYQESLPIEHFDSLVQLVLIDCETQQLQFNEETTELILTLYLVIKLLEADNVQQMMNNQCFSEWSNYLTNDSSLHSSSNQVSMGPLTGILNNLYEIKSLSFNRNEEQALESLRKMYIKIDRLHRKDIGVLVLWEISDYLQGQVEYERALAALHKAEMISEGLHKLLTIETLLKQAEIAIDLDNYDDGLALLHSALKLTKPIQHRQLEAHIQTKQGDVYLHQMNLRLAEATYNSALSSYYARNDKQGIARVHQRLGDLFMSQDRIKMALDNYELSLTYHKEISDTASLGTAYYNMAKIEFVAGRTNQAYQNIQQAMKLMHSLSDVYSFYRAHLLLAQIQAQRRDFQSAYSALKTYSDFTDSIETQGLKQRIAELNKQFELEKKERVILLQNQEIEDLAFRQSIEEQQAENAKLRLRSMLFLMLIVLLTGAIAFIRHAAKNKREKIELQQQEAELQHAILRTQMNPHFLFNSMSVIQSYIYQKDTENSSLFLVSFSRLMRLILENSSKEFIPLETELNILDKYLLIQKIRFEDRFEYDIQCNLEAINGHQVLVPPMMAQPFLENAIEHGRLEITENGKVQLRLAEKDGMLEITIDDNGIGVNESASERSQKHKSMATKITEDRIQLLNKKFGASGKMTILDKSSIGEQGTRVSILTNYKLTKDV
jgi:tetratricopeptide (TPR) repeat protein